MIGRAEGKLLYIARNPIRAAHLKRRREVESWFVDALLKSDEDLLVQAMNGAEWEPGLLRRLATKETAPPR